MAQSVPDCQRSITPAVAAARRPPRVSFFFFVVQDSSGAQVRLRCLHGPKGSFSLRREAGSSPHRPGSAPRLETVPRGREPPAETSPPTGARGLPRPQGPMGGGETSGEAPAWSLLLGPTSYPQRRRASPKAPSLRSAAGGRAEAEMSAHHTRGAAAAARHTWSASGARAGPGRQAPGAPTSSAFAGGGGGLGVCCRAQAGESTVRALAHLSPPCHLTGVTHCPLQGSPFA